MKYFTFVFIFLYSSCLLMSQKHDAHWILGYGGGEISVDQPRFGMSILQFSDFGKLDTFNLQDIRFDMDFLNVSMSNEAGELQFYTNGVGLNNHLHELMINGDGMSGFPGSTGEEGGYHLKQGGIGVPWPDSIDQYFYCRKEVNTFLWLKTITGSLPPCYLPV